MAVQEIRDSQYYIAVTKNVEFATLRRGCSISQFASNHLQLQYGKVNCKAFSVEYSSKGWFKRKIIALPMALWSIFVKTIYHLIKALFVSRKQNCYKAYRDLQAGWGHFTSLFHDRYGSFHIQASDFHIQCYDLFGRAKIKAKLLSEFENINAQTSYRGFKGEIIFVDLTGADGGEEAIQLIRKMSEEEGKVCDSSLKKKAHFGLACCVNFSIAIASGAKKIVLFDYDPVVIKFNKLVRDLLKTSSNSSQFKENLITACQQDEELSKRKFYPKTSHNSTKVDNLSWILSSSDSFLSKEKDFLYIKAIAEAGDLQVLHGSIYDEELIKDMMAVAKEEGVKFTSLFISNVYDWDSNKEKQNQFIRNMEKMSSDKTLIVEVVPSSKSCGVNVAYYIDPHSKQRYNPRKIREALLHN